MIVNEILKFSPNTPIYVVHTKVRADEVGSRNALPFVLKRGGRLVFPDEDAAKRRRSAREALRKKERKEEALEMRKDLYGFDDGEPLTTSQIYT